MMVNTGFGNIISSDRVVAMVVPESAPIKRIVQEAKNKGTLVTATCGRRTSTVILTDSQHVILSAILPETITSRCAAKEGVLTEDI